MLDIMKKRKSRRTAQPYSEMPSKKEKPKSLLLLLSCIRIKQKKKLRSKTNEDYVRLNKIEQSNPGIRCSLIHDCDGLQDTENPSFVGDTVVSLETKQNKKSFVDNDTAKELVDCEKTMTFSSQDSLQHIISTCKDTVYPDVSFEIEHESKNVETNYEKYSTRREYCNFQPETCEVVENIGVQEAFQLNICRPEMFEDVDQRFNQKPTAIVLPTRHQTNTIDVVSSQFVERNTVELDESTMINIDHETVVKTNENSYFCTSHSSLHMEPGSEYESEDTSVKDICSVPSMLFEHTGTDVLYLHERDFTSFEQLNLDSHFFTTDGSSNMKPDLRSQSEDTIFEDMDWSSIISPRFFGDNGINAPFLPERDNTAFGEYNLCSFDTFTSAGQETVPDMEDVRNCPRNDTYSEDQKSRNADKKKAVELDESTMTQFVERNTVELDESTMINIDHETVVKTNENSYSCTSHSSLHMEPGSEYESEDTFVNEKSRNADKNEAVAGIQMFCQTDAQHQDIQDSCLVHSDDLQSPQKSGHSPHSIRVGTPLEGQNISHHPQMFTKLDHDINCSSSYDMPDLCTINMTVAKLVEKVDHLESMIERLSKLVFLAVSSNSRIPNRMKKQDLVISRYEENCKTCLYDDDEKCYIKENMFRVTSLPNNSFINAEYLEQMGHCRTACICLADNTLDLESLQYNRARQVPPAVNVDILPEEMNNTRSTITGQGDAMKTKTMHEVPKDLIRGVPANQPITMLMAERPVWHKETSDETGHTLSLQISLSEENLQQNLNVTQNLEGKAEISSLQAELNSINSFPGVIILEMDDVETDGTDLLQFKASEEKDQKHNEDKSTYLSEAIMAKSINIGHTKRTSVEDSNNDAQLETATNSTTPESTRTVDSSGYSEKDYIDSGDILIMDSKPTFINSDPDMSHGRESVKDKMWNKLNLEQDETVVRTSKLNLEAADGCCNADSVHDSCLNQKENVMGLSDSVLKIKETDCCLNTCASDVSCLHQVDCNINVTPIKTVSFESSSEVDPVISDIEHIPGHGIPAQCEMYRQRQVSVGYSCHHCLQIQDKSKDKFTAESQSVQDSNPKKPRANEFVSRCKVQKGKLRKTKCILNKKKSLRSKSGVIVSCRLGSLRWKRRGKKRKVKLKKNTEFGRKVGHAENFPGILSDLKIFLHCLTSSYTLDTAPSGTLTQATNMLKGKTDFATEFGIVVSEKNNSSQERLIDDFLQSLVSTWFIFPTIRNGLQTVILLPTGLQLYFERLLRGAPPEERERMSYEWLRLQTFINYPSSAPGSGIRLARAGFYYSGNGTVTVCYACGGQHSGWNFHDDPFEIHRRISPDCPFLRGNPTYPNVPIMQEGEPNGIQMGNNASNTPLSQTMVNSPSSSNRISEMSLPAAFQSQNSTITQAQSSTAALTSIHNSQEGGSQQQASQQTMSKNEHYLGIGPSSINPASSAHVDEIPSVMHQPVTVTVAIAPNTSGESLQGQQPTTAASSLTQPQQPSDDAENTQYRNPGNFVLIKPAGQVEDPGVDPTPQTMSERPRHPEYAPLSSRVNSYTGWPARLDQTPQQMAEAGFYYAGINDYTRCFQCGGGLRNWEPGDNPWIEHARWYPQCAYVLGKRGQRFVNAVLKKQAELLAAQNAERNNSSTTTNTTTTSTTSSGATTKTSGAQLTLEPATHSGQPRYFQNPNENEIANRLINEMGYQRERVREAILEVKRMRGQQEIAVEHVIELLIADEERSARAGIQNEPATVEELIQESGRLTLHDDSHPPTAIPPPTVKTTTVTKPSLSSGHLNQVAGGRSSGQQQNGQKSGQTNQPIASGRGPLVPQSQLNMSGPMSIAVDVPSSSSVFGNQEGHQTSKSTASSRPPSLPQLEPTSLPAFDADSLREEYMRLKDQNLCKICMERNVELAFLPCGHLVCCEICGQTLRFCPICRAKIHASVKTYLS